MKKELFCKLIVLISIVCFSGSASSEIMAMWDFGGDAASYTTDVTLLSPNITGVPTLDASGGEIDTNGKDGTTGQALAWNDVSVPSPEDDAYFILTIDTTGWVDISISWDYKSENDIVNDDLGPGSIDLGYLADGMAGWVDAVNNDPLVRDDQWHQYSLDMSGIDVLEGNSLVQLMVNDLDQSDSGGKFWVDNLTITGTAVPEPATMLLLGVGGVLLRRSKR